MTTHDLKAWPPYFEAVARGTKPFEVRRDDRAFLVGDELRLHEWVPARGAPTGRVCTVRVTSVLRGPEAEQFGLRPGFCVLGLAKLPIEELIERSSLGSPDAKAARARVSDEQVQQVLDRVLRIEEGR